MKEVVISIEDYLKPTTTIDCDNEAIKERVKNVTKRQDRVADKARSLFYFVREKEQQTRNMQNAK
ncbi:MAG: hypothetical protein KAQ73_02525 [Dehalococcoidia bacterium]|nr:hypothetical protein [Dehalococcoidia bacterium]